ncbi:Uncharacterized protein YEL023C [Cyberlindnera jadinii]|uniref:Uncharacterized protein YEL023C n=1 Tax=Cyberlindnera jadinii (strain ATCC 18201 / CBS 1600 / BCRC 20928 / JCM 3617 / NBRC 0987 / NRRL Y-1542) TaxID=983966 RepID=A0A0H5C6C1_CYBJN|nr:Uncharacterized protein YEL023C [Cyberlindnera jadinii]
MLGHRNIVLCFDGTDCNFGPDPYTNLLKLFLTLERDDPTQQICYYQPGLGAAMSVSMNNAWDMINKINDMADAAVAFSLDQHVQDAYRFLMRFYHEGDKIYLFGFSRGAFTARVLGSMIDRVGLLNPGLEGLIESLWSIYSAWEYAAQPSQPDYTTTLVEEFKLTFARTSSPLIEFMGLFDTINSVGLFRDRMFPFSTNLGHVKNIRHAVSLDERRAKYKLNLISPFPYKQHLVSLKTMSLECEPQQNSQDINHRDDFTKPLIASDGRARTITEDLLNKLESIGSSTDFEQLLNPNLDYSSESCKDVYNRRILSGEYQEMWFPGGHGDVGGGWQPDINGQFLSNLPLRWMFAESIRAGVRFQKSKMVGFANRYSSLDSFVSPLHDALSFKNNGLTLDISQTDKQRVLDISQLLFHKRRIPNFRSCTVLEDPSSYEDLFNSGIYLTSLKPLKAGAHTGQSITRIYQTYQELPTSPIECCDGRGNTSIWVTLCWWILELLPLGTKIENETGQWTRRYVPNLGRARSLPACAKLHWSVLWKQHCCADYKPRNLPTYVVELMDGKEPQVPDDGHELLRKLVKETKALLCKWDSESWRIVPDDLDLVMKQFGYV